jgi:hypothetical protein
MEEHIIQPKNETKMAEGAKAEAIEQLTKTFRKISIEKYVNDREDYIKNLPDKFLTVKEEAESWKNKYLEIVKKYAEDTSCWAQRFAEIESIAENRIKKAENVAKEMEEQMEEGFEEAFEMLVKERTRLVELNEKIKKYEKSISEMWYDL